MGKLSLTLLLLVSAAANAFGYNPVETSDQPITEIFGIVLGIFSIMIAAAMSDHIPKLPTGKKAGHHFGGGGASGHW